jgi:hypothetical protein
MIRLLNSLGKAIGDSWCQLMHPDPMWPVNGEYQCRVCLRRYPVAWEQPAAQESANRPTAPLHAQPETIVTASASHTC